ncbi:MAG: site-specific integrase [Planctomycetaceae bacterium]
MRGDVDWERGRIRVRSPKTVHMPGREERTIPLFPELRLLLEQAFDEAAEGSEFVIQRYRNRTNLRTRFSKIVRRAGLTPWPKLFHNLRASRQTELAAMSPIHVVCDWIGNSEGTLSADDRSRFRAGDWAMQRVVKSGAVHCRRTVH